MSYSEVLDLFYNKQVKSFTVVGKQIQLELHTPYNGNTSITTGLSDPELFRQEMGEMIQKQHSDGILERYDFMAAKEPTYYSLILPLLIVGLVLLLIALCTGLLKPAHIADTAHFLIGIMPLLFVAPAAKIMAYWGVIKENWLPIIAITVISTFVVFAVSGLVTKWLLGKEGRKNG